MNISAVIPTRGDVPLGRVVEAIQAFPEVKEIILIAGNTPYNRYRAARRAQYEVIYTQDDDCITDLRPLIDAYQPGRLTNAMTPKHAEQYPGRQTLIGFGCLFERSMAMTCFDNWERDELFYRESDRIFGTIWPHFTVFPAIEILDYAFAANRLYRQGNHVSARLQMERRIFEKTGICA